jgi:DNA polymerase alpha subunit A
VSKDTKKKKNYLISNSNITGYSFRENANGQTFSHMFGTSADVLESFIIRNKIMGPCWLNFRNILQTNKKVSIAKSFDNNYS